MIVTTIITVIFNLVILIVSAILYPINALVTSLLPNIDTALSSISSLLSQVSGSLGYAVSWTLLCPTALQIIVLYYSFSLVFPLGVYAVKTVVNWYSKLKP